MIATATESISHKAERVDAISKNLSHMREQVSQLETLLGDKLKDSIIFGESVLNSNSLRYEADMGTSCVICMEQFTEVGNHEPRVCPCGHTICISCLCEMPQKVCVYCRQAINTPVQSLPRNIALVGIVNMITSFQDLRPRCNGPLDVHAGRSGSALAGKSVDELLQFHAQVTFEVKRECAKRRSEEVRAEMVPKIEILCFRIKNDMITIQKLKDQIEELRKTLRGHSNQRDKMTSAEALLEDKATFFDSNDDGHLINVSLSSTRRRSEATAGRARSDTQEAPKSRPTRHRRHQEQHQEEAEVPVSAASAQAPTGPKDRTCPNCRLVCKSKHQLTRHLHANACPPPL